jgi:hypothetical protein
VRTPLDTRIQYHYLCTPAAGAVLQRQSGGLFNIIRVCHFGEFIATAVYIWMHDGHIQFKRC